MIIYLHGFRSSPQSFKVKMLAAHFSAIGRPDEFHCPQLPDSPAAAIELIESRYQINAQTKLIGSSLGGFYATHLAERYGCRTVLLNPAIEPARDLARYIGEHPAWHAPNETVHFRAEYIQPLFAQRPALIRDPSLYFAIIAKGDEVLSWVEMSMRYQGCKIKLLEGSDHGLSDFADHLPEVLDFIGVGAPDSRDRTV
jgi:uncharacterized protein